MNYEEFEGMRRICFPQCFVQPYTVEEIAKDVFKINEYNLSSMFVIRGSSRALLIDCGTGVGDYKSVAEKLVNGLPYDLTITHAHVDHIGGRGQFDRMNLSEVDACLIPDINVRYRKFFNLTMKSLGYTTLKWRDMDIKPVETEPQTQFIKEGYVYDLGGRHVEVFETPGHTKGSLSYLLKEDKILFSGDIVGPQTLLFLKHITTVEELQQTYYKMLKIEGYDVVWACHMPHSMTKDDIKSAIKLLDIVLKRKNTPFPFVWSISRRFIHRRKTSFVYRTDKVHIKK